jgi:hypothetical protein
MLISLFFLDTLLRNSYKLQGEVKVMKTGNVILAIFLWILIPISIFISIFPGTIDEVKMICTIIAPLFLFILGLVTLLTGMEKSLNQLLVNH